MQGHRRLPHALLSLLWYSPYLRVPKKVFQKPGGSEQLILPCGIEIVSVEGMIPAVREQHVLQHCEGTNATDFTSKVFTV